MLQHTPHTTLLKLLTLLFSALLSSGCITPSTQIKPAPPSAPAEKVSESTTEATNIQSIRYMEAPQGNEALRPPLEPFITTTNIDTPQPLASPATPQIQLAMVKPVISLEVPTADPLQVPSLWPRLRAGFSLPDKQHTGVQSDQAWYAKHPNYLLRTSARARPYLHYILNEVEARGMPTEIALLPIVESAFLPFAYSHGRAAGIWQFIPGTGKMYGLKQNWWYDGRRDVYASTQAALDYLQKLNKTFDGDWLLALAAYNSGSGTVSRAIKKNRKKGKPTDYWNLDLPKETKGYVPKLLALSNIVADPKAFNVAVTDIPDESYFEKIATGGQIDLALAAELAGLSTDELYNLNPGFNRWATDPDGPHYLLVPKENASAFIEALKKLPEDQRVEWVRHKIKPGESLLSIAKKYQTTADLLKDTNKLDGNLIRAGKHLLVPTATRQLSSYSQSAELRKKAIQQRPRKGHKIAHTVESGDTLWDISRKHKVGVRELAKWNAMAPRDPLKLGQKLVIWLKQPSKVNANNAPTAPLQKVNYKVRRGDSLARIAQKFRVTVNDLQRWNQLNTKKYLQPGQKITLYVDVTRQSDS